jgi:hypothetical protein
VTTKVVDDAEDDGEPLEPKSEVMLKVTASL